MASEGINHRKSEAHRWLQSSGTNESSPTFAIHRTNQCSDDHVGAEVRHGRHRTRRWFPAATRTESPRPRGSKSLVAFKEGGPVNYALRALRVGDRIHWVGLTAPDGSIHLEG